ncbi:hypothetical protein BWQ96_00822 [Gracilariopsis chorda]|uniref:Uncharacterized protein n=1 Tax=Gracilariopsis chorda TaxID=448386 RepID=A0A2V3J4Z5_9FLOR|nr:hypothetical protein BWQ96_00822 [Gracilariopsis chorda]|eukprot:PXF49506.1 hypothetical protein BWQ96_00822 [Gracilariopsis chorda]
MLRSAVRTTPAVLLSLVTHHASSQKQYVFAKEDASTRSTARRNSPEELFNGSELSPSASKSGWPMFNTTFLAVSVVRIQATILSHFEWNKADIEEP